MISLSWGYIRGGIYTSIHTVFPSDLYVRSEGHEDQQIDPNGSDSDPEDLSFINEDL